jgi:hypothetical protein
MPARKGEAHGSELDVCRSVVERTLGWFHQYRRLQIRYDRRPDIHQAFLTLTYFKVCFSFLKHG